MKKYFDITVFKSKFIIIFSIIESFFQVYGYLLDKRKSLLNFGFKELIIFILLTILFIVINGFILKILNIRIKNNEKQIFSKRRFILLWFTLFILWIPVFLAFYPSIFAYDAYRQVPHLLGQNLGSFQPVFHTLLIEFFLIVGKKLASYEFGLVLYSFFQMLVMSFIFSYTIEKTIYKINNNKLKKVLLFILIFFYGIMPFNSIFSISVTKDVLFSGFLLLLIVSFSSILENKYNKYDCILFVVSSILIMLLKNSIINSYLFLLLLSMIILKRNKNIKNKIFKLQFCSIIIYFVCYLTIIIIFRPEENYKMEKYNVPMYNLMYSATKHPSVDNGKTLYNYFPRECFYDDLNEYTRQGHNADWSKESVIYCFNNDVNEKDILKVWGRNFFNYPVEYIDSWGSLTQGSYYLLDTSHTYIYLTKRYIATGFFRVEFMKDVNNKSQFYTLKKFIRKFSNGNIQYEEFFFLRFFFQPASYILLFLFMFIYKIREKDKYQILLYIPLLFIFISIMIGPCIILRYIYPFMVTLPYLIIKNLMREKIE